MWVHMLFTTGFNDPCTFPFTKLVQRVCTDEWERGEREARENEVAAFGAQKVLQLEQYNRRLETTEAHTALVDEGKIRKEDFIAMHFTTNSSKLLVTIFRGTIIVNRSDLDKHGSDRFHVLLASALDFLEFSAVLVDNDGGRSIGAKIFLSGRMLLDVDFIGVSVGGKLLGESSEFR